MPFCSTWCVSPPPFPFVSCVSVIDYCHNIDCIITIQKHRQSYNTYIIEMHACVLYVLFTAILCRHTHCSSINYAQELHTLLMILIKLASVRLLVTTLILCAWILPCPLSVLPAFNHADSSTKQLKLCYQKFQCPLCLHHPPTLAGVDPARDHQQPVLVQGHQCGV